MPARAALLCCRDATHRDIYSTTATKFALEGLGEALARGTEGLSIKVTAGAHRRDRCLAGAQRMDRQPGSMIMELRAEERHVLALVADDAAALHVAPPRVRFVTSSCGPCYETLLNRIEIDRDTLALPEPLLRIVVAHEVGHATQRRSMLLDFARTLASTMTLLAIPCITFATFPGEDLWRVSVPGLAFVLAFIACLKIWRARGEKRSAAFELDADAKAASIYGPASALAALEAMATRGHISAARLDAMRARLVSGPQ